LAASPAREVVSADERADHRREVRRRPVRSTSRGPAAGAGPRPLLRRRHAPARGACGPRTLTARPRPDSRDRPGVSVEGPRRPGGLHRGRPRRRRRRQPAERPWPQAERRLAGLSHARPALARERVRHVGDPVALVVAETQAQALDAAERVVVDYEPLPAVTRAADALRAGAALVWDEAPGNVAFQAEAGHRDATARAFATAAHVAKLDFVV